MKPAWLEHVDAPPGTKCYSGAPVLSSGPALERVGWADAALGAERSSEGVACEAAVLQVKASTCLPWRVRFAVLWVAASTPFWQWSNKAAHLW